jgi:hypothetical protein
MSGVVMIQLQKLNLTVAVMSGVVMIQLQKLNLTVFSSTIVPCLMAI